MNTYKDSNYIAENWTDDIDVEIKLDSVAEVAFIFLCNQHNL